jgi:hypothetical protein
MPPPLEAELPLTEAPLTVTDPEAAKTPPPREEAVLWSTSLRARMLTLPEPMNMPAPEARTDFARTSFLAH